MEFKINDKILCQESIDNFLLGKIKHIIVNYKPTIIELGNHLNKLSKDSNILITKKGKRRKINTFIKENHGGLQNYIEKSHIFKIINGIIELDMEEDFILL